MKKNNYYGSNTSSIAPTSLYGTSSLPFLPVKIFFIKFDSPTKIINEELIEFPNNINSKPKAGFMKGSFEIKDNFDEPLEEFYEYM